MSDKSSKRKNKNKIVVSPDDLESRQGPEMVTMMRRRTRFDGDRERDVAKGRSRKPKHKKKWQDRMALQRILVSEGLLKSAGKKIELTDPAQTRNKAKVERAELDDYLYEGYRIWTSRGYVFQDKTDAEVRKAGYDDFQEVFMGYSPSKDLFVVGYDVWPHEDPYEDDFYEDGYGGRGMARGFWASRSKKAMAESLMVVVDMSSGQPRVKDTFDAAGIVYPAGLKEAKKRFPDILGLRYD